MKNAFKFSFLAFALILILASCNYFSRPKAVASDSTKIDSAALDTLKRDSSAAITPAKTVDSAQLPH